MYLAPRERFGILVAEECVQQATAEDLPRVSADGRAASAGARLGRRYFHSPSFKSRGAASASHLPRRLRRPRAAAGGEARDSVYFNPRTRPGSASSAFS